MPQRSLTNAAHLQDLGNPSPSSPTHLPRVARAAGGQQPLEADGPARAVAPSAAAQRLSGTQQQEEQQELCKRPVFPTAARTMPVSLCPPAAANGPHGDLKIQSNRGFNALTGLGKHVPSCATETEQAVFGAGCVLTRSLPCKGTNSTWKGSIIFHTVSRTILEAS